MSKGYPKNRKSRAKDVTGNRYARLTVLEPDRSTGKLKWKCLCDCGNIIFTVSNQLISGGTKSCGCYNLQRVTSSGGITKHPLYSTWSKMISRCSNTTDKRYPLYGGRGIKVCDRWIGVPSGFHNFVDDMGDRPSPKHSLERSNNDGGYCPENCKWDTQGPQNFNQRTRSTNVSGRTGVNLRKDDGLWYVSIGVSGKTIYLGRFKDFYDAVKARESAEILYYGKSKS